MTYAKKSILPTPLRQQIRGGRKGHSEHQGLGQQPHNIAKKQRPKCYQGIIRCWPKNSEAMAMRSGAHGGLMCPLEKGVRRIETSGSGYLQQQIHGGRKGPAERRCLGQRHNKAKKHRPKSYQGIIRCRPKNSEAVAMRSVRVWDSSAQQGEEFRPKD